MNDVKIIDNFLDNDNFYYLKEKFLNSFFPWYLNNEITNSNETNCSYKMDNFYFTHSFYNDNSENSSYFQDIKIFFNKLNIFSLIRCQANLYCRTENKIFHDFHKDSFGKKNLNWTTAVYYLNSNDGNTVIKTKDKDIFVESIENRMIIFSANTLHRSTTCTNTKYRCVINFNYYEAV